MFDAVFNALVTKRQKGHLDSHITQSITSTIGC